MATHKPSTSSRATATPEPSADVPFDELVSGRLALQTVKSQLDQQAETLRAQLAVNREHRRQTEELLEKVNAKLAKQHPDLYKILTLN
jgi:hypothetical protein